VTENPSDMPAPQIRSIERDVDARVEERVSEFAIAAFGLGARRRTARYVLDEEMYVRAVGFPAAAQVFADFPEWVAGFDLLSRPHDGGRHVVVPRKPPASVIDHDQLVVWSAIGEVNDAGRGGADDVGGGGEVERIAGRRLPRAIVREVVVGAGNEGRGFVDLPGQPEIGRRDRRHSLRRGRRREEGQGADDPHHQEPETRPQALLRLDA
jgi:hypothetical protein